MAGGSVNHRRRFVFLVGASALAAPLVTGAQRAGKVPRVGVLHAGSSQEPAALQREPFERGLRENGWQPGANVLIEYRYAEGNAAQLHELAAELVRSQVNVIVARAPVVVRAARQATARIPIVMSGWAGDPVADGMVKSLARPGGNITGIANFRELDGKRLELLKDTFPLIRRVAVLVNPGFDAGRHGEYINTLQDNARALKLQLEIFEIKQAGELENSFAAMARAKVDALLVRGDPQVLDPNRTVVVALAARHRLPAVYWFRFMADAGGLMSYGESLSGMHHLSATYVSRILRGANPGEIAIEQPGIFELTINLRTAKALGVEIPKTVLFRADHLIQ